MIVSVSRGDAAICVAVGKGVHVGVGGCRVAVGVLLAVLFTLFVAVGELVVAEAVTVREGIRVAIWASADGEEAGAAAP
jgi:hypothetical protein